MPSDRIGFYNQQGYLLTESALSAIDDVVTMATGEPCDPVARTEITDLIENAWKTATSLEEYVGLQLPLTATICSTISRTKELDLADVVGTTVLHEVNRVLKNLLSAEMDIVRDLAVKNGADLRNANWRRQV